MTYPENRWYHRTYRLGHVLIGRVHISLELKLPDCWLGLYWHRLPGRMDIWLCLIPFFPLHAAWAVYGDNR